MKSVCFRIDGRVQGVGFRYWTRKKALSIGEISGWVRNVEDGSVEVLAKAPEDKLDEFILACHKGPLWSRVDNVVFLPNKTSNFLPDIKDGVFEIV